jgi:membrane-associated phospholipid phosphatase
VPNWFTVNTLTAAVAQDLVFLILLAAGVIWLFLPRQNKVGMAAQAIVSLVVMVVLIKLAAAIHTDPRPFVVDPSVKPLFAHPGDNGFPSDHTALGVTVALLVMIYRRWLGAMLLTAAIVVGAARMAAHVHHGQDIVAGMLIAVIAVGIASAAWRWVGPRIAAHLAPGA